MGEIAGWAITVLAVAASAAVGWTIIRKGGRRG